MTEVIEAPQDLASEVPAVRDWAKSLAIQTPEQFADTADRLKGIKGLASRIAAFFKPMKQQADAAKKAILDREREMLKPLEDAEMAAKKAMLTYSQEQERIRLAEQRKLQAEADERARRERLKIEQEAAKQREIEAAARAKAEAARKAAEEATAAERKKLLAQAEAAERKAEAASVKAEDRAEHAATVLAPVVRVEPVQAKVQGVSTRKTWRARVVDPNAVPRQWLSVNEKALDAYAKSMKEQASVPGVEFYFEESLAASRG